MKTKKRREVQPLLVSIEDAGDMLGIGRSKTYQLLDAGDLRAVTIGKRRLVRVSDLERFVELNTEAA